jgi:hypothetical protein
MSQTQEQRTLHLALRRRQAALEATGKATRRTFGLGKAVGLGGSIGAVWMLMISNPAMAGVVGAIALVNYALAALRETEKTGEWRPLLGHKSFSSLAMRLDKESNYPNPTKTVEDDALYLEDRELGEWLLLRTAMEPCIRFLELYPEDHRDEVLDLAAIEAYRQYGYMFRSEPDTRHQMKAESVGQYAFAAVRAQADFLLDSPAILPSPTESAADSDGVRGDTRLGAVKVASVEAQPNNAASFNKKDIATSLAVNLQSMLIVGQPGAGKGFLVAHSLREVKRLHPDVQIWAIDPKGAASEAWRWTPCDRYLPLKLNPFATTEEMIDAVQKCSDLIRAFVALGDVPKLLIFDEALAMREKAPRWFKECMTGFNALCSMGREKRQYGWLVSQSPNAEDFGISGAMRNVYRRVLVLSRSNLGLLDNGSTFFSGKPSDELLMQTGRAYYDSIDGRWAVVPEWTQPTAAVKSVSKPTPEPRPPGNSRRLMLERSLQLESSEASTDEEPEDTKGKMKRPELSRTELGLTITELSEWMEQNPETEHQAIYQKWKSRKHGFSRPEIRFLLKIIQDLG